MYMYAMGVKQVRKRLSYMLPLFMGVNSLGT